MLDEDFHPERWADEMFSKHLRKCAGDALRSRGLQDDPVMVEFVVAGVCAGWGLPESRRLTHPKD